MSAGEKVAVTVDLGPTQMAVLRSLADRGGCSVEHVVRTHIHCALEEVLKDEMRDLDHLERRAKEGG